MENETAIITCTVLEVVPVNKGRLLALASVEIEIDGVVLRLDGIQVLRFPATGTQPERTGVDVPRYRAVDGTWKPAVQLPEEVREPLGASVLEACSELGITRTVASTS